MNDNEQIMVYRNYEHKTNNHNLSVTVFCLCMTLWHKTDEHRVEFSNCQLWAKGQFWNQYCQMYHYPFDAELLSQIDKDKILNILSKTLLLLHYYYYDL